MVLTDRARVSDIDLGLFAAYLGVRVGCDDDGVVTDGEHSVGFDTAVFGEDGE